MFTAHVCRLDAKSWLVNQVVVVGFLRGACKLDKRFSVQEVRKMCSRLQLCIKNNILRV